MNETVPTNIRINARLKDQANEVFSRLGMSLSTAVNIYLNAVVREQRIPFVLSLDSEKSEEAPLTRERR
ncbi:MAG: type II toxin-antitoxin system RelB/DinJ family antitoxin [Eggerthellaceae bacterium]|jgi:DNA-damage-inducible protein J|nr:type II toxin-antitoxin system RelB/DinJ family antitoxin [Eggerthellaceae bacterium]MCH4220984.1 type II toxin-antitoxin system RelB/DinJ family antitoxin [Eggerthellaceae bacterium]